ncbi:MAG TPA: enoyl-CoA hydratase/isomerase family protein [Phycisphaerae bacterium]|nr:enoyl-CoA hydratase/isomerase family protein [Phycisphaerae bacterium]HNU45955.1 enoyl-CoA hydratase/isomerase family protein [Phycisphaerae bacterium]
MSKTRADLTIDGPRATITLKTDEGINVLSPPLMTQLGDLVAQVRDARGVRFLVLRGEGKVFAAGADIKHMAGFQPDDARQYGALGQRVIDALESLPCVTVAALNGAALGGGCEVALGCDFRLAVKGARIGLPEVSLGLVPGWGGIPRLLRLIGPARAKRLFLSAEPVPAEVALTWGLVDEVVDGVEALGPAVEAFCKSFVKASPAANALAKRACADRDDIAAFADCFTKPDSKEGISAFLEKRKASWME